MQTINKIFLIFLFLFIAINAHAQKWQWAHSDGNSGGTPPDYGSYVLAGNDDNIYLLGTYWYLIQAGQPANGYQFIKEWTKDGQFKSSVSMRKGNTYNSGASIQNFIKDNGSNTFLSGRVIDQYAFDTIQVSGGTGGYIAKFNNDNRCAWVKTGLANDVKAVAFDDKNSMYIVGPMYGTVYIDTFELQNTGNGSLYVAKLDSNANCLWVKQSFRGSYEFKQTLVSGKYIYTRGYIVDTCIVLDNISYCPNDYFVMQLDTLGNVQWLNPFKKLSGTGGYAGIGVDKNSNCYVAGSFTGIVSLGSDTLYRKIGTWVSFLAKYKPDGNVAWHKEITSDSSVIITHIHTNDAGYTYITGRFAGRTIFGKDTVTAKPIFDLSRTLECNMFIARYDANGNYLGVKTLYNAVANDITTDDSGNAIVTGSIHPGTTYFDAIQRTSNGGDDYFVAKLSAITGGNSSIKTPVVDNKLMIYANPNRGNFTIDVPKSIVTNTTAHLQIYNTAGSLIKDETVDISGTKINVDLGTVLKGLYTVSLSGNTFKTFTGKVMVE